MGEVRNKSCPYIRQCGGCASIGKPYSVTLKEKEEEVRKHLKPYADLKGIVGMEDPYCYRNKIHRVCSFEHIGKRTEALSGIYAEGTHKVIPVKRCLIEDEAAAPILASVIELAKSFRYPFYDEDVRRGLLRHILIRTAHKTGQVMVVLVLSSPVLPGKSHFIKALCEKHPEITTIVINVNDKPGPYILGEKESAAYGKGYIEDELCGRIFRISPHSFYQVNSVQTERLYGKAVELAGLNGSQIVLDAYCGIGTIGLIASGRAKEVIGVESNRSAVRDAINNAKRNHVTNITFCEADAGKFLSQMAAGTSEAAGREKKERKADVLFMDPPRSGSSEEFLSAAVSASPKTIVYISCNAETLARDLRFLTKRGYSTRDAWAFDMFPWTKHTEVCIKLERKR